MDFRPIFFILGLLLCILSLSMCLPMLADLYSGSSDWLVFLLCIVITGFFGGSFMLGNISRNFTFSLRQGFVLIVFLWVAITVFAALPFRLSELDMSYTDAFFEAMSGITTTGSTVIIGLDDAPRGILLWRAILQWLGGIGIVLMAMSILPFLNVGGMQIFKTELSEDEKALPRVTKLASSIGMIYAGLTLICALLYTIAGFTPFDALAHAMTTISTGGFSTFDTSFAHYDTAWAEIIAIIFMLIGALPFVLYLKLLQGNPTPLFKDDQVRLFLTVVSFSILLTVIYMVIEGGHPVGEALRRASFNIVSLITGTGFASGDYMLWGGGVISLFFFLMVVGGCAGSTSCGIKIFRFNVLHAVTIQQIKKLVHPNGMFLAHYNSKPVDADVRTAVMSFFFLYALCFAFLAAALSFVGLDFITAMSGAATVISNVGPAMGDIIGPTGTFAPLPDSAKWIMSVGMLVGRLEIFPILVLLSPNFWKK